MKFKDVIVLRRKNGATGATAKKYEPALNDTFDGFLSNLILKNKFDFGSGKVSQLGTIPIRNSNDLATHFDPLSQNSGATVINKEWQWYPGDFSTNSHNWASDALELQGVLTDPALPAGVTTAAPASSVTYSRQVPVADASALKVGQVVGLGAQSFANLHRMLTRSITTPAAGDVITHTFTHALNAAAGGFDTVTISVTSAGDANADAASFVSQINAHATLAAWNITAIAMPNVTGGFIISFPKYSLVAPDNFGNAGKGSVTWLSTTFTKVGTATLLTPQNVSGVNYIVSKSGNTLTLAHPITVTTSDTLTFNPSWMLEINFTGTDGGVNHCAVPDFATDTVWSKGAGWTISGGVGNASASSAALSQTIPEIVAGNSYKVTYTITRSAGSIRPSLGGTNGTSRSAAGTYTDTIVAGAGGVLAFTGTGFTGTIDNVVVRGVGSYIVPDVSGLSVGMCVQCSYQDNNLRRITAVDATNKEIMVEGAPYMQAGHWLMALPVFKALTNAGGTGTTLNFAAVPPGVAVGHRIYNYFASGAVLGSVLVTGVTATTVTVDTSITVSNGDTIQFSPPIRSGQMWMKAIFCPGMDNAETIAADLKFEAPNASVIAGWPAFWIYTASNDPNPSTYGMGTPEIDFFDVFNYWNNASTNNYIGVAGGSSTATMQAGSTATTAVLAQDSNTRDGDYVGMQIQITSGTGSGQTKTVTGYNAATRTVTVDSPWTTIPNNTSVYKFNSVDFYKRADFGSSLLGNNFGAMPRRASCIMTSTKAFFYLDGELIRATHVTLTKKRRAQIAVNLAVGSSSTSFNSNGFYPPDVSQFPIKYRIKELGLYAST